MFQEVKLFVVVGDEGGVRKVTDFTGDVSISETIGDPPEQCGWKGRGRQVALGSEYRGIEDCNRKGVQLLKIEGTGHQRSSSMKTMEPFIPYNFMLDSIT